MTFRADFLPWFRVVQRRLGELVADLTDTEVMEYVSGKLLTIPLRQVGDDARPMPTLELESGEGKLRVSLTYSGVAELKHLKNLLHPSHAELQREFVDAMRSLKAVFETRLYRRGFREGEFIFVKKYLAAKIDLSLLKMLISESEAIAMGGRRSSTGLSVYEPPATPKLHLLYIEVKADEPELGEALDSMRRVITCVSGVLTQRELIHSRISEPVKQASDYRVFTVLLNEVRGLGLISAEERRSLDRRWREVGEERVIIEEDLRRMIATRS